MAIDPITAVSLASSVAGMFGKKKKSDPYGGDIAAGISRLNAIRDKYAGQTDNAQKAYDQFDPAYLKGADEYTDYLKQDPYTDSYSNRVTQKATAGVNSAYNTASANLAASLARRGLSPDSSASVGGQSSIEAARAGQIAQAENDLALRKADSKQSRLEQLVSFLSGARQQERGAINQGLGNQQNVDTGLLNTLGSLRNQDQNNEAVGQRRSDGANSALFSQLGGFLAKAGTKSPTPPR